MQTDQFLVWEDDIKALQDELGVRSQSVVSHGRLVRRAWDAWLMKVKEYWRCRIRLGGS